MSTSTLTLTDFLLARLADDEERARFVWSQVDEYNKAHRYEEWRLSWHDEYDLLCIEPDRAIAECEAMRRIVDLHSDIDPCDAHDGATLTTVDCDTLRILALPYADHPDWREEWKP